MEQSHNGYISDKAIIGSNVHLGPGVIIYDNVEIGDNCFIGPYCVIGEPTSGYYKKFGSHDFRKTTIGQNSIIRSFTIIYEDVEIGADFQTGHHAVIREGSKIGHHCSYGSFSEMLGGIVMGNYVRIHSKVTLGENNIIEDYVWIFPYSGMANVKYPPLGAIEKVIIREYAIILPRVSILPSITIGKNAIVGLGAVVTKDVGDERLVMGNPARDIKSVRDLKNEKGESLYPWRENLKEYRGYPWQENTESV